MSRYPPYTPVLKLPRIHFTVQHHSCHIETKSTAHKDNARSSIITFQYAVGLSSSRVRKEPA